MATASQIYADDGAVAGLGTGVLPVWVRGATEGGGSPHTPDGMARCMHAQVPVGEMPRGLGETIRYVVNVDGLDLGTIDFKIERHGMFEGQPVIEYRSLFKLDALVSTFVPVEGRAASLVDEGSFWPRAAMNHYRLDKNEIDEKMQYSQGGRAVASTRAKDGQPKEDHRNFPTTVQDFVSGFYLLRRLPMDSTSCAIIYGNERAYTVWIKPDGVEDVKTPVGLRPARRYEVTYASDKSTKPITGKVWLGDDANHVPYKAELMGAHHLEATIHLYQSGAAPIGPTPQAAEAVK